ncbi:MAG TPA: hypothetical protein ENJ18_02040, partial [Nannocystis exedens]|nr:hypothetical protein [Nannocystis exedens]
MSGVLSLAVLMAMSRAPEGEFEESRRAEVDEVASFEVEPSERTVEFEERTDRPSEEESKIVDEVVAKTGLSAEKGSTDPVPMMARGA